VIGPQTYHRLPEVLRRHAVANAWSRRNMPSRTNSSTCRAAKRPRSPRRGVTAFLTVQEGCDKFCTFCVVPYTRGSEVSRRSRRSSPRRALAEAGVREITLLGQNVNAWHGLGPTASEWGLGRPALPLAEIPGLARLRYTTSHPRDMDDELIEAHRDLPS
jgi:tRNA-2-methylthio-N6-dimethylallyladenosine synthase